MANSTMLTIYSQYSKEIQFHKLQDPTEIWGLRETIGEGTYGEVFEGYNKQTGLPVAIKVMESVHEVIEEIEEEYVILRDLGNHPNMPKFHGLYLKCDPKGEDQVWLVMELCNGGSVTNLAKQLLQKSEALEEVIIAHIIKETLQALKHLHDNRVMHRDVKGHNILLTPEGEVKLVDFGVSGHLESESGKRRTSVGTPFWMAPEVIACEQQVDYSYDVRCDIWSLGITAIELAEGEPPLADQHPMRALFKIPRNPSPTLKDPDKWSSNFHDFLAKCLVKDFESRPFCQQLLNHPFFLQIPEDTTQLKAKLKSLVANTDRVIHQPDITSKRGRLKSRRKSRREGVQTAEDLACLETLDEEAIVTQLFGRYIQTQIYTYIGDILLAVNPFTPMTIYTEEYSKKYCNAAKSDHPPHIFAVADQAYQMMMHNKINQCIVISGESGAGKTESANLLVQQLTQLGKAPNRTLEDKILQVNPLMEAFGNAKTVINDNSSRFGKYLEMIFTTSGKVIGAKITEYLLEKSRVIHQARGEQNFHIFYYLHDGLGHDDRESRYHLKDSNYYRYLDGYHTQVPDISSISVNRVKFKAIQHCFEIIGFKAQDVASVYSILSSILHIGNIEFMAQEQQHSGDSCTVTNMSLLDNVSQLLGIDHKDFLEALTTSGMVTRGEIIIRNNSVREAVNARDAMAKALYGRLFSWIVNKINILLRPQKHQDKKEEDSLVVSLLDIFGFENFHRNSFEQLCINIANEQLQYYFNQHIFAWEMQEYLNEGIDGSVIKFVDNRPVLDMFLAKPMGLLALLDEESNFPRASDQTLVDKFHQNIKSSHYIRPKGDNLIFCINHYAGKVAYSGYGFLEKNRDRFPVEILNLLRMSEVPVVRTLFQNPLTRTGNLAYGSTGSSKGSSSRSSAINSPVSGTNTLNLYTMKSASGSLGGSRIYNMVSHKGPGQVINKIHHPSSSNTSVSRVQQTVATYFRNSLMDLLSKMVAGSPHFVRCIKPNDDKEPGHFNPEKVTTQLRYTGVLETTKIRRQGYSHRIVFSEFLSRYYFLGFGFEPVPDISAENCRILLEKLGLENWQLGRTKVFLKYYHIEELTRRYEEYLKKVVLAQAVARKWIAMRRYDQLRWKREKSSVIVQKCVRGWLVRKAYAPVLAQRQQAALQIQKTFRGHQARKTYKPVIEKRHQAAVKIQSVVRGHRTRQELKQKRIEEEKVAMLLQEAFRKKTAKQRQLTEQRHRSRAATIIQTYFRMYKCQKLYQQLLKYKSQKELQLIYFGQQVEKYNHDIYEVMVRNSAPVQPDFKTSPSKSMSRRRAEQQQQQQPKPDVDEARLTQMKKMSEIKTLLPEAEAAYYDGLMARNVEWTTENPPKLKDVMDDKDKKYYDEIVLQSKESKPQDARGLYLPIMPKSESFSNLPWDAPLESARQQTLGNAEQGESSESRSRSKGKSKSRRHVERIENSCQTDEKITLLYLPPLQKLPPKFVSQVPVTSPALKDQRTESSNGATVVPVNGYHKIEEDPKTERSEMLGELEMEDLKAQLEEETARSVVALWQRRTKGKKDNSFRHQPQDSVSQGNSLDLFVSRVDVENSDSLSPVSVPEEENQSPSFPPKFARYQAVLKPQLVQDSEDGQAVFNFRAQLRRTNIDWSKTIRRNREPSPEQVDFRHVLKHKTGILIPTD
ncbi:myosin-IIIb-like isoform X2 [Liolophura sinensis]|uniref:myosin-IIIb-like isoform X2 n=1 Tax=Liolophura sinensis TaxID=3198878 RepID=UPI003158D3F7